MVPIFEQGTKSGIGYGFDDFLKRFIDICEEHLENGNAKSFAFILYDFNDETIRKVLKNQDVFVRLDRLAGKELSIFYLNAQNKDLLKAFNKIFLGAFEVDEDNNLPFVLFFDIYNGEVENINIFELRFKNKMFAFKDMYDILEGRISKLNNYNSKEISSFGLLKNVQKIALDKFIEYLIAKGIEYSGQIF